MAVAYDAAFFDNQSDGSARSASVIVPLVLTQFSARSVVDFGCGTGAWLAAFQAQGVDDVTGLDGDYVDRARLRIPAERFVPTDLAAGVTPARRYDLACSLEVAEHLPPEAAPGFAAALCAAAPVVLFSAAIPGQGGTGHLHEAWQDFWRGLFAEHGCKPLDLIRPQVWGRADVAWWYQQNAILYADAAMLAARPDLVPVPDERSLDVVHPQAWRDRMAPQRLSAALRQMPRMVRDAAARRAAL